MQRRVSKQNTMKPQIKSSPAARALIERFEPYRELAAQGSDGHWRVGFGHRAAAREGVSVSRDDASLLLIYDVMQAEAAVDEIMPARLPDAQRDALTSFVHDIGPAAFRNSDVARYMFEGRVEAAAEALASYGEGDPARREAESAMILAGLAPERAVEHKPAMVDVVIKIEHPGDAEAIAAPVQPATRPALPGSILPPPAPPVLARQLAARREAEQEIARILATVGAMPQELEATQPDTIIPEAESEPASDLAPEASTEPAVEPVAETGAEPVSDPGDDAIEEPVSEPADGQGDGPVGAIDGDDRPEQADTAEPLEPEPAEAGMMAPASEAEPAAPEADPAPAALPASAQVMARMAQEMAQARAESGEGQSSPAALTQGEPMPEGISLGYVFAGAISATLVLDSLPEGEPDAEEPEMPASGGDELTDPAAAPLAADIRSEDLLAAQPEPEAEPAPEAAPEIASGPEAENEAEDEAEDDVEAGGDAASDIEADIEAVDGAGAGADETASGAAVDLPLAAAAIVERSLAVSGDDTPPPHPADTPAPSAGAVGDIAGEGGGIPADHDRAHIDELAGLSELTEDEADGDDPFSPRDLVGESGVFIESKPTSPPSEEDGWGFLATLIAGLVVAGAGALDIYGDWPRVWVERDPTWGVLATVGGAFLAITAGWMLSSVLAAKRRRYRAGQAE
tara:strand:+ start:2443 stop:4500 length:2058 start_codon:yes stop_codon:yes gene_type:complete